MLQIVLSGAVMGMIYALIAFGFQLTYSTSKTANFSQGAIVMLGGLVTAVVAPLHGYWAALPAAVAACALSGILVERIGVNPALKRGTNAWIVATIALGIVGVGAMELVFGRDELTVHTPLSETPIRIWGASVMPHDLLVAGIACAVAVALHLFAKSGLGKAFEAVSTDKDAAAMQGIPTHLIVIGSYALSAALAGLGGWAVAPLTGAGPTLEMFGYKAFCAAVVGSMSSPRGAFIVGLSVGIIESLTAYFFASGLRPIPALLACILVIAFKPTGLFGKARITKV